jgi:hypothetical protein
MGSKKSADTKSNASAPSSSHQFAPQAGRGGVSQPTPGLTSRWIHSAFTSVTRRVREDLASPKSIEVLGA